MSQAMTAIAPTRSIPTLDVSGLSGVTGRGGRTIESGRLANTQAGSGPLPNLYCDGARSDGEMSVRPGVKGRADGTDEYQRSEDERLLLIQMAGGDTDAFWTLWQTYRSYLFGICAKHAGGINEEVEDVLSRAMIKAYEKMPAYAGRINNPRAWLTRLTINLCVDVFRENKRRSSRTTNLDDLGAGDSQAACSTADSPEQALLRQEVQSRLDQALRDLPPKVMGPFVLHCVQDLACEDVGKTFSITPANVRKRIQRARCLLKQRLGTAGVGVGAPAR